MRRTKSGLKRLRDRQPRRRKIRKRIQPKVSRVRGSGAPAPAAWRCWRDPPRLVVGQRLGCRSRIIEVDIRDFLAIGVADDKPTLAFLDGSGGKRRGGATKIGCRRAQVSCRARFPIAASGTSFAGRRLRYTSGRRCFADETLLQNLRPRGQSLLVSETEGHSFGRLRRHQTLTYATPADRAPN